MTHTRKQRGNHSNHRHTKRDPKHQARKRENHMAADTTEIIDPDVLGEMMNLLERVDAGDLPPQRILLRHHVKRPRHVPQQPDAIVILEYVPSATPPADEAEQEENDAYHAAEKENHSWDPNDPSKNYER